MVKSETNGKVTYWLLAVFGTLFVSIAIAGVNDFSKRITDAQARIAILESNMATNTERLRNIEASINRVEADTKEIKAKLDGL